MTGNELARFLDVYSWGILLHTSEGDFLVLDENTEFLDPLSFWDRRKEKKFARKNYNRYSIVKVYV